MKKVSILFGTRPEAIKLCPLVNAFHHDPDFTPHVCVTGQHRQMLDQVLDVFDVRPDVDLNLMRPNQTLAGLTSNAIAAIDGYFAEHKPDMVIVQGDTTTAFCGALAAFYRRIPVGHVEAGLRTWNRFAPFPEEINRTLVSRIADRHFAPTQWAADNLIKEGVPSDRIHITGNTGIDALHIAINKIKNNFPSIPGLPHHLTNGKSDQRLVLITGHRRENFGKGLASICKAIANLAEQFEDIAFVYPVHLNPNVREPVYRILGNHQNIHLIEPLNYLPFVALMNHATLILTDSGGIQEEAPSLGKPVLVMRDTTERPEAVEIGSARLVGTDSDRIQKEVSLVLTDERIFTQMTRSQNPYGDGQASSRIINICRHGAL
jgi:UDP-N-acetylglucosamine 2-epimerase (non-hydrolysing)